MLCASNMLKHLGFIKHSKQIKEAVLSVLAAGKVVKKNKCLGFFFKIDRAYSGLGDY